MRPTIKAVRNLILMCTCNIFQFVQVKEPNACPQAPQIIETFSQSGISESTKIFLVISGRTSCVSCVNTNFLLNGPSLLVYAHLNLGFVISTYIKPKHLCLCLLHIDQVVLADSCDSDTLLGNTGRRKEHYRREKRLHLQQNGQGLWRSGSTFCINMQ